MMKRLSWFHVEMKRARILTLLIYSLLYGTVEVKSFSTSRLPTVNSGTKAPPNVQEKLHELNSANCDQEKEMTAND